MLNVRRTRSGFMIENKIFGAGEEEKLNAYTINTFRGSFLGEKRADPK